MYNSIEDEFFPSFEKKLDTFESLNDELTLIAMQD